MMKNQRMMIVSTLLVPLFSLFTSRALSAENERSFNVQNFQFSPGHGSYLTVEGGTTKPGKFNGNAGGLLNYQFKPLVVQSCEERSGDKCTKWGDDSVALVKHHLSLELFGALSLFEIVELGIALPIVFYQSGEDLVEETATIDAPKDSTGLGDLRVHLKLDLLHGIFGVRTSKFELALLPVISFPIGNAIHKSSFMGDSTLTVHPKLAFGVRLDKLRIGVNLGYLWRGNSSFFLADVGQRISYGAAVEIFFSNSLSGLVEVFGQTGFKGDIADSPLEADVAVRHVWENGLGLIAGMGAGILAGIGTPVVRAFAGLTWSLPPKAGSDGDADGDGLSDKLDNCPNQPEDKDRFEDQDGCPDMDNDQDGIPDTDDNCPLEAEDRDEFEDDDGCPDPDTDKDGIEDAVDKCPTEAEDKDDFEDQDGCPDADNDSDGILDQQDKCPDNPEDKDKFEDEDGCPDVDNDKDGIVDTNDKCPDQAEILNGVDDDDGCPDKGKELIVVKADKLELLQKIRFANNSDKIIGKESFEILDVVVSALKARPDVKIRIEGHTDSKGKADYNRELSDKRAKAVMRYLVKSGIDKNRLQAVGYGEDKPIADNNTKAGQAANRRVEFFILSE